MNVAPLPAFSSSGVCLVKRAASDGPRHRRIGSLAREAPPSLVPGESASDVKGLSWA